MLSSVGDSDSGGLSKIGGRPVRKQGREARPKAADVRREKATAAADPASERGEQGHRRGRCEAVWQLARPSRDGRTLAAHSPSNPTPACHKSATRPEVAIVQREKHVQYLPRNERIGSGRAKEFVKIRTEEGSVSATWSGEKRLR